MRLFLRLVSLLLLLIGTVLATSLEDAETIAQEINQNQADYFKENDLEKLSELFITNANLHVNDKKIATNSREEIKKYYEAERESGVKVVKYLSKNVDLDGEMITVHGRFGIRRFYEDSGPWELGNYTKVIVRDVSDQVYRIAEEIDTFYSSLKN